MQTAVSFPAHVGVDCPSRTTAKPHRKSVVFATLLVGAFCLSGCGAVSLPLENGGGAGGAGASGESTTSSSGLSPGQSGYIDPGGWAGPLHKKYAGHVVFS